jgi:hypothetical protein
MFVPDMIIGEAQRHLELSKSLQSGLWAYHIMKLCCIRKSGFRSQHIGGFGFYH